MVYYAPGRSGEHAAALLKGYTGILQTDGYAAYGAIRPRRPDPRPAQVARSRPCCAYPSDLARLVLGVTLGLRVLARSNPDRELLEGVARSALSLLDWPQTAIPIAQ